MNSIFIEPDLTYSSIIRICHTLFKRDDCYFPIKIDISRRLVEVLDCTPLVTKLKFRKAFGF